MAFGLQSILMFFFPFLCLSLNIQFITLAQCMSPKILQGFHGLGRRAEQLARSHVSGVSSFAHTNRQPSSPLSFPPELHPTALLPSVPLSWRHKQTASKQRVCTWISAEGTQAKGWTRHQHEKELSRPHPHSLGLDPSCPLWQCRKQSPLPTRRGTGGRWSDTSTSHSPTPVLRALHSTLNSWPPVPFFRPQVRSLGGGSLWLPGGRRSSMRDSDRRTRERQ